MTGAKEQLLGDERTQLESVLAEQRAEMLGVADGLTDEQARRRLVPSLTSPLAILKHAVFVETVWAHVAMDGQNRADLGLPETAEGSWTLRVDDTVESVRAQYAAVVIEAQAISAGFALDDHALHNRRSPLTVRWVLLHLIRELARHNGHADILREQILAEEASSA